MEEASDGGFYVDIFVTTNCANTKGQVLPESNSTHIAFYISLVQMFWLGYMNTPPSPQMENLDNK